LYRSEGFTLCPSYPDLVQYGFFYVYRFINYLFKVEVLGEVKVQDLIGNVNATMTSKEIATLTGKTHKNVLRDIDVVLKSLSSDMSLGFKSSTYKDISGKTNRMFDLDKDSSLCLISGYDANIRMIIIKRWQELEKTPPLSQLEMLAQGFAKMAEIENNQNKISQTLTEQQGRIEAVEEKQLLQNGDTGFLTVLAYARINNLAEPLKLAVRHGKACTKLSKELNINIGRVSDERWGYVNSYHVDILNIIFKPLGE